jgi:hypothetical protein
VSKSAGGTRRLSFFVGALNAVYAVLVPVAVLILATTLVWIIENDPHLSWLVAFRTALSIWFVSHGVGIEVSQTEILGIAVEPFVIGYPALGLMLIVIALGRRTARKLTGSTEYWPGWLGALSVYVGASVVLLPLASGGGVMPNSDQAVYLPAALFGSAMVLQNLFGAMPRTAVAIPEGRERISIRDWWKHRTRRVSWFWASISAPAFKAGTGVIAGLLAISSVMIGVSLTLNWVAVTRLYEGLQVSFIGALVVTLGQLMLMPNIIFYGASWLTGAGFSIGIGSMVSPVGTQLGPIPALPVFGGLPIGTNIQGLWILVVPILLALFATVAVRAHTAELRFNFATPFAAALSLGLSIGVVAAIEAAVLAFLTSGALGPGRLAFVGINPLVIAGVVFLEVAPISILAAFYSARPEKAAPIPDYLKR